MLREGLGVAWGGRDRKIDREREGESARERERERGEVERERGTGKHHHYHHHYRALRSSLEKSDQLTECAPLRRIRPAPLVLVASHCLPSFPSFAVGKLPDFRVMSTPNSALWVLGLLHETTQLHGQLTGPSTQRRMSAREREGERGGERVIER